MLLQTAYLLAGIAAIWLLATVCPFVSLHVVFLDETHVTLVAAKRFLSCKSCKTQLIELFIKLLHYTSYRCAATYRCESSRVVGGGTSE